MFSQKVSRCCFDRYRLKQASGQRSRFSQASGDRQKSNRGPNLPVSVKKHSSFCASRCPAIPSAETALQPLICFFQARFPIINSSILLLIPLLIPLVIRIFNISDFNMFHILRLFFQARFPTRLLLRRGVFSDTGVFISRFIKGGLQWKQGVVVYIRL